MIERAILNNEMYQLHKRVLAEKLSGDVLVTPSRVTNLLDAGVSSGEIKFDDFYNTARGYIFVNVHCGNINYGKGGYKCPTLQS